MEELIKRLERVIQTGVPDKDGMHPISAETVLEVVKSQLSTNLAEVGTDCISREQAIDALENDKAALSQIISGMSANDAQLDHYLAQRNQVVYDIDAIKQLPSIQPAQPKRGKWIKTARWGRVYYCDQCRNYLDFDGVNAGRGSTNYCPNCGADMRGEQE